MRGGKVQCGGKGRALARKARTTTTTLARSKKQSESAAAAASSSTSTSSASSSSSFDALALSRRDALLSSAAATLLASFSAAATPRRALAADAAAVGTYLQPSASIEGFSHYVPSASETPAIRAGVIKADPSRGFYSFDLPSSWRPQKMANVLTG